MMVYGIHTYTIVPAAFKLGELSFAYIILDIIKADEKNVDCIFLIYKYGMKKLKTGTGILRRILYL